MVSARAVFATKAPRMPHVRLNDDWATKYHHQANGPVWAGVAEGQRMECPFEVGCGCRAGFFDCRLG